MLDAVAEMMNDNPALELIEVHANASLADLADLRARNVVQALVRRGVAPHRLKAVGVRSNRADVGIVIARRSKAGKSTCGG
jgi:hypothetical protein